MTLLYAVFGWLFASVKGGEPLIPVARVVRFPCSWDCLP